MDIITTPAGQYTVPATSIVHNAQASLTDRSPASVVHLTQYDTTMPIIAVALTANGQPYTVPSGAAVNVRLAKPDGTYVYNPAYGLSEDRQTVYIAVTVQMTVCIGKLAPVVEVVIDGGMAATGFFILDIDPNPIPEDAIDSTDEYKTIQQLAAEVQKAAQIVTENAQAIQDIEDNLAAIQGAAGNAQSAAASATLAESWAIGGTDTRSGEDTNNSKYWADKAQEAAASAEGPLIGTTETLTAVQVYDALQQGRLVVLTSTCSSTTYSNFSVGNAPYLFAMAPSGYNSDGSFRMTWLKGNFDSGGWSNDYGIDGMLLDTVNTSNNGQILYVHGGSWTFQSLRSLLLNMVYPVGSIYISYNSTNPATLFGGSWTRIQGRFLLAAGSLYPAGSTGGEAAHTLSQEEMPRHYHLTMAPNKNTTSSQTTTYGAVLPTVEWQVSEGVGVASDFLANTDNVPSDCYTGGSKAHNNMPPYLAVYMWRRTA